MIRLWHDSAMRWMPLWLTITMLNSSVLLGLIFWRRATGARDLQPPTSWLLVILWLAIAFYIVFGHVRTRCQRFEMTLPIRAEHLWRRHLVAVFLAGGLILAGSFAVLILHTKLLGRIDGQALLVIPYSQLVGPLLAGLLLATALVTGVEPGLQKLRGRTAYWALVIGAVVGIPLLLLLLIDWPLASTALCLILASVILLNTRRSLPAAYRLFPVESAPARATPRTMHLADKPVSRGDVYRTLFGILHQAPPWKQFTPWMVYTFVALMGFVIAGGIDRWKPLTELRFLYLPFGSYMLFAGIGILTYNLYRLDPLPVSRGAILATLTLPGLVFYCLGYGTGWWMRASATARPTLVDFHVEQASLQTYRYNGPDAGSTGRRSMVSMVWVEVDPGFMGVSLAGEPPTLESPWGEAHEAWSVELLRGLSPVLYNPYNTAEETSPDFEALMLSRAIEDVYGKKIAPAELRDRYFVIDDERITGLTSNIDTEPGYRVQGRPRGIPLLDDYPDLVAPPRGPETAVFMLPVIVPWLLLTALFLSSFKATLSPRFIRGVYWAGLAIPMLGLLLQAILPLFGLFSPTAGRGFVEVLIRSLGAHPTTWLLAWLLTITAILASYRLALRQFERAEIPTGPINCSLVDWGKTD